MCSSCCCVWLVFVQLRQTRTYSTHTATMCSVCAVRCIKRMVLRSKRPSILCTTSQTTPLHLLAVFVQAYGPLNGIAEGLHTRDVLLRCVQCCQCIQRTSKQQAGITVSRTQVVWLTAHKRQCLLLEIITLLLLAISHPPDSGLSIS